MGMKEEMSRMVGMFQPEKKRRRKKIEEEWRREGRVWHSGDLTLRFSAFCDTENRIE